MTINYSRYRIKIRLLRNLRKGLIYLVLVTFVITSIYPLVWLIFGSFKRKSELYTNVWLWPRNPSFANYAKAWTHADIGHNLRNTLIVALGSVILVLVIGILAGYAFARIRFPGSDWILAGMVLTMMIQPAYMIVELFRLTKALGIIDTYLGLILPYASTSLPLALALFTAYFRAIPQDLEDAARIDGASWFIVLTKVVLPLAGPVVSVVVIIAFLDAYNELLMALVLLKGEHMRTISVGLANLMGKFEKDYPELFAATNASLLPVVIVYLIFQRRFISGLLSGAIKG